MSSVLIKSSRYGNWNVLYIEKKKKRERNCNQEKSCRLHYIYANYSFCYVSRTELLILHPRIFCEFKFLYFISSNWPAPGVRRLEMDERSVKITRVVRIYLRSGDLVTRNEGRLGRLDILFIREIDRDIKFGLRKSVVSAFELRRKRDIPERWRGITREGGKIRGTCTRDTNKSRVKLCKHGAEGVYRLPERATRTGRMLAIPRNYDVFRKRGPSRRS